MSKSIVCIILLPIALLAGCWDSNEPERMLYINGMGIDYKDGKVEVYAQIIDFSNTAKSEQPSSDQPQVEIGYASGETMDGAITELYHSVDQKIFWGHFSYLVFSEEALKSVQLSPVIDSFIRYRETRYQIWVYTTRDALQDVLLVRPVINKSVTLSKLSDPENSFEQESFIYPTNIRKLLIGLDEPGHQAALPLISVKENWESIDEPIKAPVLSGLGVISRNGLKGFIAGDNARGLQWMTNETKRGELNLSIETAGQLGVIIEDVKVKITPVVTNGITFNVTVKLQATLSTIEGKASIKQIKQNIEKEVHDQIMDTYYDAIEKDIDIYRFSEQLYRKELQTWKKYQKDGALDLTEDSFGKLTVQVTKLTSDRKSYKETIKR
ncbi:Ger(x)C family spore germination protein [Sporosarcina sp. PTS2304]|uniref:Ger(x)C family spore germination protein n=1 Tax=Sporosarcina sp. PTS2304 TaxID=2283194 RepID=UPI000E0DBD85|nr:Ger(x)C family spore germination protein [Sporosarcina sp. PTS2304]AXI00450.1 Ger(x)C family spore germination protein [Sporosarcina sp. PTS2304]